MAKTTKIPKRIAGVKVPKDLRRVGNAMLEKANSPEGREMIAAGLTMAAAAAAAAMARSRRAADSGPASDAPAADAARAGASDPMAFVHAVGGMAEAALGTFFAARKA